MILRFFEANAATAGIEVKGREELLNLFQKFPEREPFFCELVSADGYKLMIGIRGHLACAQHSPSDGAPPYMVAVTTVDYDPHDEVEFTMENEVTAIKARYVLPFELVKEIAAYFVERGGRSPIVEWDEI